MVVAAFHALPAQVVFVDQMARGAGLIAITSGIAIFYGLRRNLFAGIVAACAVLGAITAASHILN